MLISYVSFLATLINHFFTTTTGSSSLAFCNKSLAEEATDINKINYAQCTGYGNTYVCPNNLTGGDLFYVGQVYQGDVGAYNDRGEEIASMDNVSFTIMESEQMGILCDTPLDGIIGVSYTEGNDVVQIPSSDFDTMSLWNESCSIPNDAFSTGYQSFGFCSSTENTTTLPSPLQTALTKDVESGYNKFKAFGVYLDYAATIGSKTNTIIPSLGAYFGGDLALNNQFYNGGNAQVVKQVTNNCQGEGNPLMWYQLGFNTIRVPGLNFTLDTTELCKGCATCFTDSGNSLIQLPLPEEDCNSLPSNADELKALGSLFIDLDGADGENATLTLPILWLAEQIASGYVQCTGTSGDFVLGFPIFQYYYLAYNMGDETVTFVELELSNETKTFIEGPELGGAASTSAGYLLYQAFTTGILALASCIYLWK